MEIKVKYFDDELIRLAPIDKGDWIDLRAAETIEMNRGEFRLIPLGVAMRLPIGYEAHIAPRGSTFRNFKILQTNSVGVVDESYCGDNDQWFFPALAVEDTVIHKNDRICQFRLMEHQRPVTFDEVKELKNPDRGGHGSTGVQ